jgi:hypothetical protein
MSRYFTAMLLLGLALLLAVGYALFQQNTQQNRLDAQLRDIDNILTNANNEIDRNADNALKGIEASVEKSRNQPAEVASWQAAERLRHHTRALRDTLQAYRATLRRATGNAEESYILHHPNETSKVARLMGTNSRIERALRQQLAAYAAHVRQLHPADSSHLIPASFDHVPVVAALAAFTHLESDVLASESHALQQIARHVGAVQIPTRLKIMASAESNRVGPGATYQAQLFMAKMLLVPGAEMFCNGQPITPGPDGVAHVRFRASKRPGPATWKAAIHIHINGRDTTFQTLVSYQVAHP